MPTKQSVAASYLWNSMTQFEQELFVQCVAENNTIGEARNDDKEDGINSHNVVGTTSIESPEKWIADALSDDNYAAEKMLVKLVNNNVGKLAMKLLTEMAATAYCQSFVKRSLKAECVGGGTLLHEAAKYGCIVDLGEFITTDVLSKLRSNDNGDTPLHLAAAYGHVKDVEVLLEKLTIFSQNEKGWTPLHYAVSSERPSLEIVSSLIQHVLVHAPRALDVKSYESQNTALHLACQNKNADEKLLKCFGKADPTMCNTEQRTPIHLAAEREHDPQPIEVLLKMFLPRMSKNNIDTLLSLCAKNGHRDAVALLLRNGADPQCVLHDIVDESVKRPDKITKLLAVYEAIVENVIVPDSRWLAEKCYIDNRRQRVIELVEEPNRFGKNVIERAIEVGAKDVLLAILNSSDVYRIDSEEYSDREGEQIEYDVTNMIPSTMSIIQDANTCRRSRIGDLSAVTKNTHRPAKSYMEMITENDSIWREHDILQMEPFRELTKSYVRIMRFVYLLVGTIHLAYITSLSVGFLPRKCWLNEQFALNLNDCNTTNDGDFDRDLNWGWVIWPGILLIFQLFSFLSYMISVCRTKIHSSSVQYAEVRDVIDPFELLLKILYKLVDKVLFFAFSAMTIYWYTIWPTSSDVSYNQYLLITSMMFLFGWLLIFILLSRVFRGTYVLSLVLKSVMVRDILLNFAFVFLMVILAFTCTFYVLQLTLIDNPMDFGDTFYEIFVTAFTLGNLYELTVDPAYLAAGGNRGFLKAVYVAYLSMTTLILFNYLIAMMTHRYEKEIPHAENAWRFDCVASVLQLDTVLAYLSRVLCFVRRNDHCCVRLCCQCCKQKKFSSSENRYYTKVPRWCPWLKYSSDDN